MVIEREGNIETWGGGKATEGDWGWNIVMACKASRCNETGQLGVWKGRVGA